LTDLHRPEHVTQAPQHLGSKLWRGHADATLTSPAIWRR
jgi:hypothetical protein